MLENQHGKKMNLRTLKWRLKDYGLSWCESFVENLVKFLSIDMVPIMFCLYPKCPKDNVPVKTTLIQVVTHC